MNRWICMMTAAAVCALQGARSEAEDEPLQQLLLQLGDAPLIAQLSDAVESDAGEQPEAEPAEDGADIWGDPAGENEAEPPAPEAEPAPQQDMDDPWGDVAPEPATPEPEPAPELGDLLGDPAADPAAEPVQNLDDLFGDPAPEAEPGTDPVGEPEEAVPPAPTPDPIVPKDDAVSGPALEEAERIRRKAREIEGLKQAQEAYTLLNRKEYDAAQTLFLQALENIPDRPATEEARKKALWGYAEAALRQAEILFGRVSYQRDDLETSLRLTTEAEGKVRAAMTDEDGHGAEARRLLRRVQASAGRINELMARPIPPKYREDHVVKVRTNAELYDEGRKFFELEDFDKAESNFTEILRKDPYHRDAMRFLRRIEEMRLAVSNVRRQTTRADMLQDVAESWNPPIRSIGDTVTARPSGRPVDSGASARLLEKMQGIVIPSIEFRQANIVDVISFLREASEERDPARLGVNIILKLDVPAAAPAAGLTPAPAADPWGAPVADPWGAPAAGADAGASEFGGPAEAPGSVPITLTLRRVTLLDAIRYVTDVANLKYRVEDNAVIITPKGTVENVMTRLYPVQPSIVEITSARAETTDVNRSDFITIGGGAGGGMERQSDMKTFFEQMGVPFPPGTSITYNQSISQLIVRNTPENLEILERIIQQLDVIPRQVEIEARFVEVSQNDLEQLGFEWLLTDNWEIAQKKGGGPLEATPRVVMGANVGDGGFTKGVRYYTSSTGADQPTPAARSAQTSSGFLGNLFSISSILTNPEVSLVVHALEQKGMVDVLSSPRVTCKSGVNAFIKVVEEIIYPTEYQSQQVGNQNIVAGGFDPGGGQVPQQLDRPPVPSSFETREVGVIMNVTPIVGADGQTVDLTLVPEVSEFVRWIDYGPRDLYPILQPIFATRNVTTSVSVWDGQTIVMGGLIREQAQKMDDRIPILGDIPLLGRLFRNKGELTRKSNLMIFVTARIVDPAGNTIRRGGPAGMAPPAEGGGATPAT
jgi:general secretion pathway protein D